MAMLRKLKVMINRCTILFYSVPGKICSVTMMLVAALLTQVTSVCAAGNEYDFMTKGGDMFNDVNDTLNKTAASGMNFFRTLAIVFGFCAIGCAGIGFMYRKTGRDKSVNKDKLFRIIIGLIVVFGVGTIASLIASIGDAL